MRAATPKKQNPIRDWRGVLSSNLLALVSVGAVGAPAQMFQSRDFSIIASSWHRSTSPRASNKDRHESEGAPSGGRPAGGPPPEEGTPSLRSGAGM
jgi:hypothetical protein